MQKTELLSTNRKENASVVMSSIEIAQLCEKRHDNVMADIRIMLETLKIQSPDFSGDYIDSKGRTYPCFYLPKRETMILVSGYRIDLRAKIIDRLDELEKGKQEVALPQNYAMALRQLADTVEQNQQLSSQITSMESYFRNGITAPQFAKGLNGVNSQQINEHLRQVKWLYKDSTGDWRVSSYARDRYMTEETSEISAHGKDPIIKYKPTLLKKGAAKLYEWYTQGKLTMKANWNGEFTQDKAVGL
ncbi:antirepressor [Pasteurellaceae bacterium Macca]|nr:antirepressor [Pasteurellaceae bacterium Macca]MCK3656769.1 antirepressor [Pasteurellaceae bacterium Macca]